MASVSPRLQVLLTRAFGIIFTCKPLPPPSPELSQSEGDWHTSSHGCRRAHPDSGACEIWRRLSTSDAQLSIQLATQSHLQPSDIVFCHSMIHPRSLSQSSKKSIFQLHPLGWWALTGNQARANQKCLTSEMMKQQRNIERLIARCESILSGKATFTGQEWKLSKVYIHDTYSILSILPW